MARHLRYWAAPFGISALLVLIYFLGSPGLSAIVAPPLNREYGLLENLQLLILVVAVVAALRGLRATGDALGRTAFALIAITGTFLFLEEMDYGLHFWSLLSTGEATTTFLNIHNQGDNIRFMKKGTDAFYILFFIVLPLATWKVRAPLVRRFVADPMFVTTLVAAFLISSLAHFIDDWLGSPQGSLRGNIAEFRETFTYYCFALYTLDLLGREKARRDIVGAERTQALPEGALRH